MKRHIFYIMAFAILAGSCKRNSATNVESLDAAQDSIDFYDDGEQHAYSGGQVSVSEDGALSIEAGAYPDGGTSPEYWAVFKFLNGKGDTCRLVMDNAPYMDNVHSIHKNDGSTFYTVECMSKASSSDGYEWLQAYRIVGDSVMRVSAIDGGKNYEQDQFAVEYCIPNWYFATWGAGYDWMYEYDVKTRNLYVPLTDEENHYDLTDRYRVWHFNGEKFVEKGEYPNRRLHPILAEYKCLIKYYTTKDFIVRVDSLSDKTLRYASWKKPKTMADTPDMVIKGGKRRQFSCAPDEYHRSDDFYFVRDGYEYIVNYDEIIPDKDGSGATFHIYLLVKKGSKTILKQEKEERE